MRRDAGPIVALTGGVIVTFACLGWMLWSTWSAYQLLHDSASDQLRLQRLLATMARLDEVLSSTAKSAAVTSDLRWGDRHAEAVAELNRAFAEIALLAPPAITIPADETHANRGEVTNIETVAIDVVRAGAQQAASDLLFGLQYEHARIRNTKAAAFLTHSISSRLDGAAALSQERFTGGLVLALVVSGGLLLVWIGIAAGIRRNHAALAAAEQGRRVLESRIQNAQRLESLSVLAGGIAHDFNNLLTGILSNAGTARRKLSSGDSAQQHLSEIVQGSKLAAHLTGLLLAYTGKGQVQIMARDLSAEVGEIKDLMETAVRRRARLSYELAQNLPAIQVDPSQLQQALMNLVLNASESIEGEVEVTVRTCEVELTDADIRELVPGSPLGPGTAVALEVEDAGWGMDSQTLARVFDPFFTTKAGGRGLGLAATLGIAHRHGGGIRVTSRLGNGTQFRLLFPPSDQPVAQASKRMISDLSGQGLVLVVDDDDYILQAVYATLESFGYSVLMANSGRQAIAIYEHRSEEIDLVLLDMSMPGMSGEETSRILQQIRPDAKLLLSTGYGPDDAELRFTGPGLAGFLRKPYDIDELAETVKRLIARDPDPVPTARLDDALRVLRESYRRKLPHQLDTLGEALRQARDSADAARAEDARALAHRLAGTAGSYGFSEINQALERVDNALRGLVECTPSPDESWKTIDASMLQVWDELAAQADNA